MFASHQSINHSIGEYVRGDVHTNTIEGYFSVLKLGITGTYHHVSLKHLKRYLAEFDFRYNERMALGVSDEARADNALRGIVGKRLMYRVLLVRRIGLVVTRILLKIELNPSGVNVRLNKLAKISTEVKKIHSLARERRECDATTLRVANQKLLRKFVLLCDRIRS